MQDNQKKPDPQSPADIAREAFRRLAARRIAPTPDAYREIYEEIAGTASLPRADGILTEFAASLTNETGAVGELGKRLARALQGGNWPEYRSVLQELLHAHILKAAPLRETANVGLPVATTALTIPANDVKPPVSRSASIPLVDEIDTRPAGTGSIQLVDPVEPGVRQAQMPQSSSAGAPAVPESLQARMLRDLLSRTLTLAVCSLLQGSPELAKEAEGLAASVREARTSQVLTEIGARLKQLCFKIELKAGDMAEEHELLLRLFRLLLENIGELLEDDSWLRGQLSVVQNVLSGPLTYNALMDATRSLKEVIYKQSMLKHSLSEAKVTVKNMMLTFIDRLGDVATSTDDYHKKMDKYAQKISQAKDIGELNRLLHDVMRDTRTAQTDALRSRDAMVAVRNDVQQAEARIGELESQLEEMSELVREDQLTGSLNRRGLDEVLERELARAERKKTPLCLALLDLDDFKRLNDTHGHSAGDKALIHLVQVVKDTLRTMDVIGRFGGEEFMIVLPDTLLEDADRKSVV